MMTKSFVQTLVALLLPAIFHAQTSLLSVETDPSTFALKGYAVHFRVQPKSFHHLALGAGVYALDFPSLMVNLNAANRDEGWDLRVKQAVGLFGEYYLLQRDSKWFVGIQAGAQQFRLRNSNQQGVEARFTNLLLMPSIGYKWYPFRIPVYFKPWMGIGYTTTISGNTTVGDRSYSVSPLIPFITLHTGYTFGQR